MSELCPDVVVTAGGTRESIDDVRCIANFSTGEFGIALANQFARIGKKVLLLAPDDVVCRFGVPEGVKRRSFTDAESLRRELAEVWTADLVLHAAAVADYTPERVAGKISSNQDELTLKLKRTQKILPLLRSYYGDETTIIGFKLLSNVPESELVEVATDQILKAKTNFCIANDLKNHGDNRLIHIVSPDGSHKTHTGAVSEVAERIVNFLESKGESHGK